MQRGSSILRTAIYPTRLTHSAGVPAQLARDAYVEDLAHLAYYWGYPAIDVRYSLRHFFAREDNTS